MPVIIIGDAPLLAALKQHVPEVRGWGVPVQGTATDKAQFLAMHVPNAQPRIVLVSEAADWLPVVKAGWTVYWADGNSMMPYGTKQPPREWMTLTVGQLATQLWKVPASDKRLVGTVLRGQIERMGTLLSVTSASGGVGKTTSARRLADRAARNGIRTLLIDGNIRQSSQRSFFDPYGQMNVPTVADWRPGMHKTPRIGATHGKTFGVPYDLAFAPPQGASVTWEHYRRFIRVARQPGMWEFIVLDLDRISPDDLHEPDTVAGGLLLPAIMAGDPCLMVVKAGKQPQADAMHLLEQFRLMGIPKDMLGIKDVLGVGIDSYEPSDYEDCGVFLGTEHMTVAASKHLNAGETGWDDPALDYVREKTLAWALPDRGFNPEKYRESDRKGKGKRKWK